MLTGTPELYASTLTTGTHEGRDITYEFLGVVFGTPDKLLTHLDFSTWLIFSSARPVYSNSDNISASTIITVTTINTFYVCTFTKDMYTRTFIHVYASTHIRVCMWFATQEARDVESSMVSSCFNFCFWVFRQAIVTLVRIHWHVVVVVEVDLLCCFCFFRDGRVPVSQCLQNVADGEAFKIILRGESLRVRA